MKCNDERIQELIALYHDGSCSDSEKQAVERHIETCKTCKEEFELYAAMAEAFKLDEIDLPEHFHEDMMGRLKSEINQENSPKKQAFYTRYKSYMNVAAMLVFVILLSVVGLTKGNDWFESSYVSKDETSATESTGEMTISENKAESKESYESSFSEETTEEAAEETVGQETEAVYFDMADTDDVEEEFEEETVSVEMEESTSEEEVEAQEIAMETSDEESLEEPIESRATEVSEVEMDQSESGIISEESSYTLNEDDAKKDGSTSLDSQDSESEVTSNIAVEEDTLEVSGRDSGAEADVTLTSESKDKNDDVSIKTGSNISLNGNGQEEPSSKSFIWIIGGLGLAGGLSILIYRFLKK